MDVSLKILLLSLTSPSTAAHSTEDASFGYVVQGCGTFAWSLLPQQSTVLSVFLLPESFFFPVLAVGTQVLQ